jgi:hypothetical protein
MHFSLNGEYGNASVVSGLQLTGGEQIKIGVHPVVDKIEPNFASSAGQLFTIFARGFPNPPIASINDDFFLDLDNYNDGIFTYKLSNVPDYLLKRQYFLGKRGFLELNL